MEFANSYLNHSALGTNPRQDFQALSIDVDYRHPGACTPIVQSPLFLRFRRGCAADLECRRVIRCQFAGIH
jgi:hypothetical protein